MCLSSNKFLNFEFHTIILCHEVSFFFGFSPKYFPGSIKAVGKPDLAIGCSLPASDLDIYLKIIEKIKSYIFQQLMAQQDWWTKANNSKTKHLWNDNFEQWRKRKCSRSLHREQRGRWIDTGHGGLDVITRLSTSAAIPQHEIVLIRCDILLPGETSLSICYLCELCFTVLAEVLSLL